MILYGNSQGASGPENCTVTILILVQKKRQWPYLDRRETQQHEKKSPNRRGGGDRKRGIRLVKMVN